MNVKLCGLNVGTQISHERIENIKAIPSKDKYQSSSLVTIPEYIKCAYKGKFKI